MLTWDEPEEGLEQRALGALLRDLALVRFVRNYARLGCFQGALNTMAKRNRTRRVLASGAVVLGLAAGSYGVAAAASGNGSSSTGNTRTQPAPSAPDPQNPWGAQRSDETPNR